VSDTPPLPPGPAPAGRDPYRTEAGVWCRECGSVTLWIIQTAHAAEGIVRLRRCRVCGVKFRSIEIYLSAKAGNVCEDYPAILGKRPTRARS
jgi:hypothetical protein